VNSSEGNTLLRNVRLTKITFIALTLSILAQGAVSSPSIAAVKSITAKSNASSSLWVSAYYAIWVQRAGVLTPQKIDYTAFSHLIQFHDVPADDGTLNAPNNITPDEAAAVVTPAHAAGRKVILCIGGGDTSPHFRADFADSIRPQFIDNLIQRVEERHYDGLDIDMEPLEDSDVPAYTIFIKELRLKMLEVDPKLLLPALRLANLRVLLPCKTSLIRLT
jgi:GH18 family chitinase